MKVNAEQKVGQVVAEDYRTADVFKKFRIDFCCGGGMTITEACNKKKVDQEKLIEELTQILSNPTEGVVDYHQKSLAELIDIIITRHHSYVVNNAPILREYLKKIASVHGVNHPELIEVLEEFLISEDELAKHMKKEEEILFPFVLKMEESKKTGSAIDRQQLSAVISEMLNEHENEGDRFARIQEITNDFEFPHDACNTYKVAFHKLKEFQNDLHLHIHLENNILFPEAVNLEKQIFQN